MFLAMPPSPPTPTPNANAYTGHNFVTNTPINSIFAIAIEVPDYNNPMIFLWWPFCIEMLKMLVASLTLS